MQKAELMTKATGILNNQKHMDVQKLGEYIGDNVVGIDVYVKYPKSRTQMPTSLQKMKASGILEHGDAFYNARVSKASITYIPKEYIKELHRIEQAIRRRKDALCVAGDYMPAQMFDSFKMEFAEAKKEFFSARDKIIANWNECASQYEKGVREIAENISMDPVQKEQIVAELLSDMPTKEEYEKMFEMTMTVYVFPSKPNRPALAPEITTTAVDLWDASVAAAVILSIEQLIGQGWERLNAAMKQFRKNGAICAATISTIVNYGRSIPEKNLFKNDLLTYLQKALPNFLNMTGEQQVEEIERCIVKMYVYAKSHHIELDMDSDCAYSVGELDAMAKSVSPVETAAIKVSICKKAPAAEKHDEKPAPYSRYSRLVERRKEKLRNRQTAQKVS